MLNTSAETAVAARNATGTDFRIMSQNIIGTSSRLYQKTQKSTRTFSLWWGFTNHGQVVSRSRDLGMFYADNSPGGTLSNPAHPGRPAGGSDRGFCFSAPAFCAVPTNARIPPRKCAMRA